MRGVLHHGAPRGAGSGKRCLQRPAEAQMLMPACTSTADQPVGVPRWRLRQLRGRRRPACLTRGKKHASSRPRLDFNVAAMSNSL